MRAFGTLYNFVQFCPDTKVYATSRCFALRTTEEIQNDCIGFIYNWMEVLNTRKENI